MAGPRVVAGVDRGAVRRAPAAASQQLPHALGACVRGRGRARVRPADDRARAGRGRGNVSPIYRIQNAEYRMHFLKKFLFLKKNEDTKDKRQWHKR